MLSDICYFNILVISKMGRVGIEGIDIRGEGERNVFIMNESRRYNCGLRKEEF